MATANIRAVITAEDRGSAVLAGFASTVNNKLGSAFSNATAGSKTLLTGLTALGGAVVALGTYGIKTASDIQSTQQSMIALTHSTKDTQAILGELYKFVQGKPLTFPDISEAAKTLLGYGVTVKDVTPLVESIGKVSIVTGANMQQVALAMGQVNARGKLMGQDALQLINNSIPVTTILAKELGISIQEAADKMNGGQISAETFNKAMINFSNSLDISKFSNTFQNRVISLQGSLRSLAFSLIGVKVDPVKGFVVEAGGLFDRLSKAVSWLAVNLKKVPDVLKQLQPYIPVIAGAILGGLLPAFVALISALGILNPYFLAFVAVGALVGLAVKGLGLNFNDLKNAIDGARLFFQGFLSTVIPIGAFIFSTLKPIFDALVSSIRDNLIPVINKHKDQLNVLGKVMGVLYIVGVLPLVTALTVLVGGVTVAINVVSWLIRTIQNAASKIAQFAKDIKSAFDDARDSINNFFSVMQQKFDSIKRPIDNTINKVEEFYASIKQTFDKVLSYINPFSEGFSSRVSSGLNKAKNALIKYDTETLQRWGSNLTNIGSKISSFFSQLPAQVGGFVSTAAQNIGNRFSSIYTSISNTLTTTYNKIITFFTNLPTNVGNFVSTAVTKIGNYFSALPQNILNTLNNVKNTIVNFFSGLADSLKPNVDSAGDNIGKNLTKATSKGFRDRVDQIGLAILAGLALVLASVVIFMVDMGLKAAKAFVNTIKTNIRSVGKLGSWVVNAIGNLGGLLYDAGRKIIGGLLDGIKDKFNDVKRFISGIGPWIRDHKGPLEYDKTLLIPHGKGIMEGFNKGLTSGWENTQNLVSSIAPSMAPPASSNHLSSSSVIPNNKLSGGSTINLTIAPQIGVYAGTPTERRKLALTMLSDLRDLANQKNITVSQLLGANRPVPMT